MDEINGEEYTIVQLRDWLRRLNLPMSGNKAALVLRLNDVPVGDRGVCPEAVPDEEGEHVDDDDISTESVGHDVNHELELLRKELALAEREKRLLKMENELLKREHTIPVSTPSSQGSSNLNVAAMKEFLPEYDGTSSVELWITQLENLGRNFALQDEVMKALLMCNIKGNAQAWLHSKPDYISADIRGLLNEMRAAFQSPNSKLTQRRKFESRRWAHGESFQQYFSEKIRMSVGLQLEETELIEHLIEGINNYQLRTQATIQCFTRSDDLLRAFSKVELPNLKRLSISNTNDTNNNNKSTVRCYNCNSLGHYAKECKKTKREAGSCYGCGSPDHVVTSCPQRKNIHLLEDVSHIKNFKIYVSNDKFVSLSCLIDSGCPISFVKKKCVPKYIEIQKCNHAFYFGLNKSELKIVGKISCFLFQNNRKYFDFIVVENESMGYDSVLGRDFMKTYGIKLVYNFEQKHDDNKTCKMNENLVDEIEKANDMIYKKLVDKTGMKTYVNKGINYEEIIEKIKNVKNGIEEDFEHRYENDNHCPSEDIERISIDNELFTIDVDSKNESTSYKLNDKLPCTQKLQFEEILKKYYLTAKRLREPKIK